MWYVHMFLSRPTDNADDAAATAPANPQECDTPGDEAGCDHENASLNDMLESSKACRRKMKLWEETRGTCIYCGRPILARNFVAGLDSDIEHIIPRALGGYSKLENLACSCRDCNREKGNLTAIDYMLSKDSMSLQNYLHRIRIFAISGMISEEKYQNLLKPQMLNRN